MVIVEEEVEEITYEEDDFESLTHMDQTLD
jgi:hypothetical protein